jgi:hypothetical protein
MKAVENEPLYLPVMPHSKAGATCNGSIVAVRNQEQITPQCNACGAVVGTVHAEVLKFWNRRLPMAS